IQPIGLKHVNLKKASDAINAELTQANASGISEAEIQENIEALSKQQFAHLHNHTQFSVLQSTIGVDDLVNHAVENQQPAVALTDHGNMMGAFEFVKAVNAHNAKLAQETAEGEEPAQELRAIVGCEFFVCEDHQNKSRKDNGYQIVMLAKNKNGYQNLIKMSSLAYTDGFYYVPRIDKTIVEKYKDDVIVLTGNLQGEVPGKVLNIGEKQAEEALLWWKDMFG